MCAIFGILGSYDFKMAHRAFETLRHRGPDEHYCHEGEDLFFGHYRLAVVDAQHKQVSYKAGVRLAFNGEIYNFKEVKKLLSGYDFCTEGDSEVILAAYLAWGESFVERLKGMFAIALFDERSDTLLLFRDRLGKKPLYYYHDSSRFVFASEIKAILALGLDIKPNKEAMTGFLSFQTVMAPHTFYEGIVSLQAGEKVLLNKQQVRKEFYDDILPRAITVDDEREALKSIENLLYRSVTTRLPQETKASFLLSGGVDSALLCAMAQRQREEPIQTYTIGYEGESRHDESAYAKEVADHIGAKNERIVYGFEDFKRDIKDILLFTDQPLNDPALLPLSHLLKSIRKTSSSKVILSGEGSDELFLGYRPYREFADIEQLARLEKKQWLKNFFQRHPSEHREWEWYRRILEGELLFRSSAESFTQKQRKRLIRNKKEADIGLQQIQSYYERFKEAEIDEPLLWYRYIDLKVHQSDYFLMKLDRVSMYHGLEARTPYLDEDLVKESLKIDTALFLKEGSSKYLLKQIALKYLPSSIVMRKKQGFSYPFVEWLEAIGGFKSIRMLNDKHKVFEAKALKELLESAGKGHFKQHIFGVYLLLIWIESQI